MMNFIKYLKDKKNVIVYLLMFLFYTNCSSSKSEEKLQSKAYENQTIIDGYNIGSIEKINQACQYIIIEDKSGLKYDPININEFQNFEFKDKMEILFQYRRLRRPNRCEAAQPIELIDVKKLE